MKEFVIYTEKVPHNQNKSTGREYGYIWQRLTNETAVCLRCLHKLYICELYSFTFIDY